MATIPWHDDSYKFRALLTVQTAPTSGSGNYLSVSVKPEFDLFWDNVQSDGYDVVFYSAHVPALPTGAPSYNRSTWNYTNKSANFEVQYLGLAGYNYESTADTFVMIMYWGATTTVAVDPSTTITTTTGISYNLALEDPDTDTDLVVAQNEAAGSTTPLQRITLTSYEQRLVWFKMDAIIGAGIGNTMNGRETAGLRFYRVDWAGANPTDAYTGGAAASKTTQGNTLVVEANGSLFIGLFVTGLASGTNYVLSLRTVWMDAAGTTPYQYIESCCAIYCQDISEP